MLSKLILDLDIEKLQDPRSILKILIVNESLIFWKKVLCHTKCGFSGFIPGLVLRDPFWWCSGNDIWYWGPD